MRVGSAGTHPFSLFERQRITAKDRYRQLVDQLQYIARRELIFGMHIHVAIDDPDKAIKVMNGLLPQLAPLLALSASSPFWRGEPTGLMSSRQMVFSSFPRSGPPPRFRDYADYAEVVGQLERTGCIADYTHIWWDIRPHPRLGTIEIRICDAVTRVEDAVAITAYCQALVKQLSERHDAGEEIPSYHRILTTENKWLAARYGLEAPVMDLATGRRNRIPIAQLVRRTVREIEPHARELGSERELEGIAALLARGNSADRQLRIFNANRDIREVVEEIAIATETLPVHGGLSDAPAGRPCSQRLASGPRRARARSSSRDALAGEGPALLCFYPFDWSPTCTNELLLLRDRSADLDGGGHPAVRDLARLALVARAWAMTLGVDSVPLLSDWSGEATRGFGVAFELAGDGRCRCAQRVPDRGRYGQGLVAARERTAGRRRRDRGGFVALALALYAACAIWATWPAVQPRRRPLPGAARGRATARRRQATTSSSGGPSGSPGTSSSAAPPPGPTRTPSGPRRRRRPTCRAGSSGSRSGRCGTCSGTSGPTT